ncbi:TOPRS ligase, partial [Pygoscelis papua]
MATASEDRCPICLDTWDNAACTMPCLHRFCFNCIRRWAEIKPECPLCKRRVTSIRHSLRGDEFEEFPIRPPAASLGSAQEEGAYRLPAPRASREHQPWNPDPGFVGGLSPWTWGSLFRNHPDLFQPLRPWLRQELGRIFGEGRSEALMLEHMIQNVLPVMGLHEADLVESLQADLGSRTTAFVQGLIRSAVERCRRAAYHLLVRDGIRGQELSPAASRGGQELSPVASTSSAASRGGTPVPGPVHSSSAAAADADELPGTSTAALRGGPSCPSVPAPIPGEQEELHKEPGEAAAGASAPSQARGCSRRGPRRPLKRKASSSEDSAAPARKPPRR